METAIIERDDSPEESNIPEVTPDTKPPEAPPEEKKPDEGGQPVETPAEEEKYIEFEGQRYTATQFKEMQDAYQNKTNWQKSNTERAQEIAAEKARLAEAELVYRKAMERPDVLQKLFTPEPARNLAEEIRQHYALRPSDPNSQEYVNWEYQKDLLTIEKVKQDALRETEARMTQAAARESNERLEKTAWDKYSSKGTSLDDFKGMASWIANNMKAQNGQFPANAFDVAYAVLYGERATADAKIQAARESAKAIAKAKPAGTPPGVTKQIEQKNADEEEDAKFLAAVKERADSAS